MKSRVNHEQLSDIDEIASAVSQLASRYGYATENVISDLEDKVLGSPIRPEIEAPSQATAYVAIQDSEHADPAVLVIHACRMGSYLAKGSEEIKIPFDYNDNTAQEAVDRLFDSKPGTFTSIYIGNQTYTLDSSLKTEVYNALMAYLAKL